MFRSLLPSRSRSHVPSLAPSWSSLCLTLWLVLMTTSCYALCGLSAFTSTGLLPWLLFAIAFSCLLVAPCSHFRRTLSPSSCAMLLPLLGRLGHRWVGSGLMSSVVYPPPSHSTVTGLSPRFWSPPLGAPVWCSHHFIFVMFNTNMMAFCLWVRLWLRVRGSGSPHLFLTCSGGGGGPAPPLSPLPRSSFTCFSGWMQGLPIQ